MYMRMNNRNRKSSPRRSKKRQSLKKKGRAKSPKRQSKRRSLKKKRGGFVELPTNQV